LPGLPPAPLGWPRFPSVERSEGTTGFSRWGNRVKFQL
jgi:hypothetical protein